MSESERKGLIKTVNDLKHRDPFRPFSIVVTSGDRYRIESPDNLVIMATEIFYASPRGDDYVIFRQNQIVSVVKSSAKGNSRKSA